MLLLDVCLCRFGITSSADKLCFLAPVIPAIQVADIEGGMYATIAILAALCRRGKTGKGEFIDISLTDAAVASMIMPLSFHFAGESTQRGESFLSGGAPFYNVYETADRKFISVRRLAYLENNSAEVESGIVDDNKNEIQMILWDMAQAAYLKQSSELAEFIQKELNVLLGTENRGIKQAPFKVLTGVACPAVLVEVAFISNPEEERKLGTDEFQNNVAQAVYRGLVNYLKASSQ